MMSVVAAVSACSTETTIWIPESRCSGSSEDQVSLPVISWRWTESEIEVVERAPRYVVRPPMTFRIPRLGLLPRTFRVTRKSQINCTASKTERKDSSIYLPSSASASPSPSSSSASTSTSTSNLISTPSRFRKLSLGRALMLSHFLASGLSRRS